MSDFNFKEVSRTPIIDDAIQPSELIVTEVNHPKTRTKKRNITPFEVKTTVCEGRIRIHLPDICNRTNDHSIRKEIEWELTSYLSDKI